MTDRRYPRHNLAALVAALVLTLGLLAVTASAVSAANESPVRQEPSPTPTGGEISLPTATPTIRGGPTATPSSTPTLTPVMAETFGDPTTNLRTGPGLDFDIIAELSPGEQLPIIGRWLGFDWYLVQWPEAPNGEAWIYAPLVIVRGDITTVPAVDPPSAPTPNPTQVAINETAAVIEQTPGAVETATAVALAAGSGVATATAPAGEAVPGVLPTFTPPPPFVQPDELAPPVETQREQTAVPPAVIIVSMAAMGVLMLVLGVLRRLF